MGKSIVVGLQNSLIEGKKRCGCLMSFALHLDRVMAKVVAYSLQKFS